MRLNPVRAAGAALMLALAGGPALAQVSPGAPVPAAPEVALTTEQIVELQTLLTQLGFDPLGIDGIFGPATEAAVMAAQQSFGLPADGVPTLELLERLRVAAAELPPAPAPMPIPGP